jgi:hypothetical protein
MTTHELKTWPAYYDAVARGDKTFEVRRNDRDFVVGDHLWLREWDPATGRHTGRDVVRRVSYVLRDAMEFGVCDGFVVLALGGVS